MIQIVIDGHQFGVYGTLSYAYRRLIRSWGYTQTVPNHDYGTLVTPTMKVL